MPQLLQQKPPDILDDEKPPDILDDESLTGDNYKGPSNFREGFINSVLGGEALNTGLQGLKGYVKGATIDIPESIIGGAQSAWNLAKDIAPIPGNRIIDRIKSIPSGLREVGRNIRDTTMQAGAYPEEFGRTMGQITGQPVTTMGLVKGAPSAFRGAGAVTEKVGNIMKKYQPVSGVMPRLIEGRTLRNIEKNIGAGIESVGKRMRGNRIKTIDGEIVGPVDAPFEEGQIIKAPEPVAKSAAKIKVRPNRDGTFTNMSTGEILDSFGNPLPIRVGNAITKDSPFFAKNRR